METCSGQVLRILVFICTLVIFVIGVIIFGVSIAAVTSNGVRKYIDNIEAKGDFDGSDIEDEGTAGLWALAVIGILLALFGFCGCCGAWKEHKILLGLFFSMLLIIALIQLVLSIVVLSSKGKIENGTKEFLEEAYGNLTNATIIKQLQDAFECCGVNGTDDSPKGSVEHCKEAYIGHGCVNALWEALYAGLKIAGIVVLVMILIEIVAMVCTCFLIIHIRKRDNYQEFNDT